MTNRAGTIASLTAAASLALGANAAFADGAPPPQPTPLGEVVLKSKTDKMAERTPASLQTTVDKSLSWACSGDQRNGWVVNGLTLGALNSAGKIKWNYVPLASDYLFGGVLNDGFLKQEMPYTHNAMARLQENIKAALAANPGVADSLGAQIQKLVASGQAGNKEALLSVVDLACAHQPLIKQLVTQSAEGIDFKVIAGEVEAARTRQGVTAPGLDAGPN